MLEWCSIVVMTISSPCADVVGRPGVSDEVERLGGVAGEEDLVGAVRADEARHLAAGRLVRLGRLLGQGVDAPVDVGVVRS